MFEIELKFKINGREVPCDAFIGALRLQIVEAVKAAIPPHVPEPPRQTIPPPKLPTEPRAFSLNETSKLLSVSQATIRRRIPEGKIRAIRVASRVLVPSESFRAILSGAS